MLRNDISRDALVASMLAQQRVVMQFYLDAADALEAPLIAMADAMTPPATGRVVLVAESGATALLTAFGCSEMVDTYGFERVRVVLICFAHRRR